MLPGNGEQVEEATLRVSDLAHFVQGVAECIPKSSLFLNRLVDTGQHRDASEVADVLSSGFQEVFDHGSNFWQERGAVIRVTNRLLLSLSRKEIAVDGVVKTQQQDPLHRRPGGTWKLCRLVL